MNTFIHDPAGLGARIWAGAGFGVAAAAFSWTTLVAFNGNGRVTIAEALGIALLMLFVLAVVAGPGALLLSCIHAAQMGKFARRARSKSSIRTLGILLGMPLGVANLILILFVCTAPAGEGVDKMFPTKESLVILVPALAGGAGLGWGATFGLEPGGRRDGQ